MHSHSQQDAPHAIKPALSHNNYHGNGKEMYGPSLETSDPSNTTCRRGVCCCCGSGSSGGGGSSSIAAPAAPPPPPPAAPYLPPAWASCPGRAAPACSTPT